MLVAEWRRALLTCAVIIILALTLTACGDNNSTPTPPTSPLSPLATPTTPPAPSGG